MNDAWPRPTRRRFQLGLAAASALATRPAVAQTVIPVAAASDVREALAAIIAAFEAGNGTRVRATYGSTGTLARQIAQGAPFDLFLAADESFAERLIAEGHGTPPGAVYAIGRLALITRRDSGLDISAGLEAVRSALGAGRIRRFAIANPEHAPYGARAREALEKAGLLPHLASKLVLAENVSQATQHVLTGAAEAGITGSALTKSPEAAALSAVPIPANMHTALRQRMVLTKRASTAAGALFDFIVSPAGQAILAAHGFEAP